MFTIEYTTRELWREYHDKDPSKSNDFAHQFRWNKDRFFVPSLKGDTYVEFEPSTILPFMDEQPIYARTETRENMQEHGAYGQVYSFQVLPEYNLLSVDFDSPKVIRRSLSEAIAVFTDGEISEKGVVCDFLSIVSFGKDEFGKG